MLYLQCLHQQKTKWKTRLSAASNINHVLTDIFFVTSRVSTSQRGRLLFKETSLAFPRRVWLTVVAVMRPMENTEHQKDRNFMEKGARLWPVDTTNIDTTVTTATTIPAYHAAAMPYPAPTALLSFNQSTNPERRWLGGVRRVAVRNKHTADIARHLSLVSSPVLNTYNSISKDPSICQWRDCSALSQPSSDSIPAMPSCALLCFLRIFASNDTVVQ